jgi:hypothetical protein
MAAGLPTGGVSSLYVPDVVHSEHFRVVTPPGHGRRLLIVR